VSCFALVLLGCRGTQYNDGHAFTRRTLADASEHVTSGPFRQVQIKDEQDRALGRAAVDFIQETKRLIAVCEDTKMQIHTGSAQGEANQLDIGSIVFYDRDPVATRTGAVGAISPQRER
jgi:hypothetical protein